MRLRQMIAGAAQALLASIALACASPTREAPAAQPALVLPTAAAQPAPRASESAA
jgi:hypothetical protein